MNSSGRWLRCPCSCCLLQSMMTCAGSNPQLTSFPMYSRQIHSETSSYYTSRCDHVLTCHRSSKTAATISMFFHPSPANNIYNYSSTARLGGKCVDRIGRLPVLLSTLYHEATSPVSSVASGTRTITFQLNRISSKLIEIKVARTTSPQKQVA